jgi:hypothetical protein
MFSCSSLADQIPAKQKNGFARAIFTENAVAFSEGNQGVFTP